MHINASPFAASPNGHAEVITTDAAEAKQKLQDAINKVILEHYGCAFSARTELTTFAFLFDQTVEHVPEAHPLDVARALYVRLHPAENEQAVSEAFSMGSLIATALRNRPTDYKPATIKDESEVDFTVPTGDPVVDAYIWNRQPTEQK